MGALHRDLLRRPSHHILIALNAVQFLGIAVILYLWRQSADAAATKPSSSLAVLSAVSGGSTPRSMMTTTSEREGHQSERRRRRRGNSVSKQLPPVLPRHPAYQSSSFILKGDEESGNVTLSPVIQQVSKIHKHPRLMQLIEQLHSSNNNNNNTLPTRRTQELLVLIRIPKTASTSIITLLQSSPDLYTLDFFLENPEQNVVRQRHQLGCIFGHNNNNNNDVNTDEYDYRPKRFVCPHIMLGGAMRNTIRWMRFFKETQTTDAVALHPFTMVRDPFDRWVSLFYYMYSRRDRQMWKNAFTAEQIQLIADQNLSGWLQSLHQQQQEADAKPLSSMLTQQDYLSPEAPLAKSLLEKGRVVMLVMECFDVSVKLLLDIFPHLLSRSQVEAFLQDAKDHHRNVRHQHNEGEEEDEEEDEAQRRRRLSSESSVDLEALRRQSLEWFPQHFEFYRLAVAQFQKDVMVALHTQSDTTLLTQLEVDACFNTLSQKVAASVVS